LARRLTDNMLHIHAFRFCAKGTKHGSLKHVLLLNLLHRREPICDGLVLAPEA